jgi:hypothetical protein
MRSATRWYGTCVILPSEVWRHGPRVTDMCTSSLSPPSLLSRSYFLPLSPRCLSLSHLLSLSLRSFALLRIVSDCGRSDHPAYARAVQCQDDGR